MLGIYIHIPFCNNICSYCDFCKMFYKTEYVSNYLDSLELEINSRYKNELVDSIYIGGGTPNSLNIDELKRLMDIIKIFRFKDNYEFTIECNIDSIDRDKLILFKNSGVNRISFGVESFDKDNLLILGRVHNAEMVIEKINLSKKYFDNINIDLIYGINDQIEIVSNDIDRAINLGVTHVSCYSLILEENTKLYINKHKYIDEDVDYEMFKLINKKLTDNGFKHYEISNYAKDGYDSLHNKNYWLNGEYYGFGLSAVSYLGNKRISNTKNLRKYFGNEYVDNIIEENIEIRKENDLMLGLRMIDGFNYKLFNKKYDDDLLNRDVITKLIDMNKLIVDGDYIKCNYQYIYLLNDILIEIMGSDL